MGAGFVGAEPVAVAVDGDGDAVVEEPVEKGCCDGGVSEDVAPFIWKWHTFDFGNSA